MITKNILLFILDVICMQFSLKIITDVITKWFILDEKDILSEQGTMNWRNHSKSVFSTASGLVIC